MTGDTIDVRGTTLECRWWHRDARGPVLVLLHELVSRAYWGRDRKQRGLLVRFLQAFKMGMVLALTADTFKLGS